MENSSQKTSLFVVFLIVATELIGFGLIIPVLPQLAHKFETNYIMLSLLMAAYSFAQFIAAPLLGHWSDKLGRKPILIISKLGSVLSYLILAFAGNYWLFLISRLLDGFTGGNISVARAYIADITTEQDRPKGMAVIGISFGLGFILGPALGGLLYGSQYGLMLPALAAGGLSLLALILTVVLLKESVHKKPSDSSLGQLRSGYRSIWQLPIAVVCVSYMIYMIVFSGFETTFSLLNLELFNFTERQNSWAFMYAGVLGLFVQGSVMAKSGKQFMRMAVSFFLVSSLSIIYLDVMVPIIGFTVYLLGLTFTRWQASYPKRVVIFGLGLVALACLGFSMMSTTKGLFVILNFMALGIGLVNVYLPSLLTMISPDDHRGSVMGVYEGIGSLARVIGPVLAYSIMMQSLQFGYLLFAITLSLLAVLFAALLKSNGRTNET